MAAELVLTAGGGGGGGDGKGGMGEMEPKTQAFTYCPRMNMGLKLTDVISLF